MKALIVGSKGQLGRALQSTVPAGVELFCVDVDELDITRPDLVNEWVDRVKPDILFNAAAYTAVDKAEQDEETALAINGTAVGTLADAARRNRRQICPCFDRFRLRRHCRNALCTGCPANPLSAYGRTKLVGEQLAGENAIIVRTAWVYAPVGNNFVRTMLRLMSERPEVRVVADQIGTPTYAPALAEALWRLVAAQAQGLYHYTDSGVASWYDFAVAIQEEGMAAGLLAQAAKVVPINTADFPTPAHRPSYSVLDKSRTFDIIGGPAPHWRDHLRRMIAEIKTNG